MADEACGPTSSCADIRRRSGAGITRPCGRRIADRLYLAFREGAGWGKPIDLGDQINRGNPWGAHLGPDGRTLYFSSDRSSPVRWPRSPLQAEQDLARLQAWDNGNDNLWSISLQPWLDQHTAARG